MKNTLTTNKLEYFYNSYYIYRFTQCYTFRGLRPSPKCVLISKRYACQVLPNTF